MFQIMRYIFGTKVLVGGKYSLEKGLHDRVYVTVYPARPTLPFKLKFGKHGESGVYLRNNDTFYNFYWKPVCPSWVNSEGKIVKSKRFQFTKFRLRALSTNKGKIMSNDEMATVELVSSEATGYLNAEGQFVHGTPPAEKPFDGDGTRYVQTDEDAIEG